MFLTCSTQRYILLIQTTHKFKYLWYCWQTAPYENHNWFSNLNKNPRLNRSYYHSVNLKYHVIIFFFRFSGSEIKCRSFPEAFVAATSRNKLEMHQCSWCIGFVRCVHCTMNIRLITCRHDRSLNIWGDGKQHLVDRDNNIILPHVQCGNFALTALIETWPKDVAFQTNVKKKKSPHIAAFESVKFDTTIRNRIIFSGHSTCVDTCLYIYIYI